MSTVVHDIFGAVYKKYADTAALNTLTHNTTSMFREFADVDADPPLIIVHITSMIPTYTFNQLTTPFETIRLSFRVIDDSKTAATIDSIMDAIEAAYGVNGTALSFADSTYTHKAGDSMRILGPLVERVEDRWHGNLDYQVILTKAS